jgi:hypothetical protein
VELAEVHDVLVGRERAVALVNERAVRGAAHEIHSERHGEQTFTLGTHLPLEAAGQRTGIRPNSIRYHDAIEELEYEGAIEWDTGARYARGDKHYIITERGLEMLREPG